MLIETLCVTEACGFETITMLGVLKCIELNAISGIDLSCIMYFLQLVKVSCSRSMRENVSFLQNMLLKNSRK